MPCQTRERKGTSISAALNSTCHRGTSVVTFHLILQRYSAYNAQSVLHGRIVTSACFPPGVECDLYEKSGAASQLLQKQSRAAQAPPEMHVTCSSAECRLQLQPAL